MREVVFSVLLMIFFPGFAGGNFFEPAPGKCVLGLSGGLSFSANDFSKEDDGLKPGFIARAHFPSCGFVSFVLEYNHLFSYDVSAAWVNVSARDYDALVSFGNQFQGGPSSFYAFTGMSVKTWNATYTGVGENRITPFFVTPGSSTRLIRFCANFGIALERKISDLSLFGDFRFRLSPVTENVKVEIMDIMYTVGLKYNFIYRKEDRFKKERFRLPGNKYNID
ncbi:MAG: hypothetical protein IT233_11930 [Bacteroidia bacterium]|nr:hypothetical protein [Bacteroidia bacterium]